MIREEEGADEGGAEEEVCVCGGGGRGGERSCLCVFMHCNTVKAKSAISHNPFH